MRYWIVVVAIVLSTSEVNGQETVDPIEFTAETSDGLTIYGDLYDTGSARPILLLFHQGRSNGRAEFSAIVPRLVHHGYSVVTVDQRGGGDLFGGTNRTVEADTVGEWTYCDAIRDLEATLDFAAHMAKERRIILWGGSYTGSLVIRLASDRGDDVDGVLAFSPASGGPMQDCRPDEAAARITVSAIIFRPASEMEIESVQKQMNLFSELGLQTFVAGHGVHASSMLDPDRTGADTEPTWDAVLKFLAAL